MHNDTVVEGKKRNLDSKYSSAFHAFTVIPTFSEPQIEIHALPYITIYGYMQQALVTN